MTDQLKEDDLALYLGKRIIADAAKLRLFMPDCFARFPVEWDGHEYEIRVIYQGKGKEAEQ